MKKPVLIRITTVPISLKLLITGQIQYMQNNGFDVYMASADGKERAEVIENEGRPHTIIPMTRAITPLKDIYALYKLIQFVRKTKPDIVHTHTPKAGLLGMMAAKICGVPLRLHTVAGMPLMVEKGAKLSLLKFIEKLTYWCATEVWPNSYSLKKFIETEKFAPDNKVKVISAGSSNGIDLRQFHPDTIDTDELEEVKQKINYQEGKTYLLAVGRMVKDKGIEELVTVFQEIKKQYPNLRLVLLGPYEAALDPLSKSTGDHIMNDPDITHINWSDRVKYYMHLANLLVHASHREGFPNVLLQAGAMRLPIVCSTIPGNIDLVSHKKTGLLFETKSVADLTEKLNVALSNKEQMDSWSKALFDLIHQRFSRVVMHQEIRKKYLKLLNDQ